MGRRTIERPPPGPPIPGVRLTLTLTLAKGPGVPDPGSGGNGGPREWRTLGVVGQYLCGPLSLHSICFLHCQLQIPHLISSLCPPPSMFHCSAAFCHTPFIAFHLLSTLSASNTSSFLSVTNGANSCFTLDSPSFHTFSLGVCILFLPWCRTNDDITNK